ncbi:MAG: HlyC/CorC family transporter [Oscillospiraceae bacterium]|nr:HlyC/CorC family transporter [Oscillospiraceae bacterium]
MEYIAIVLCLMGSAFFSGSEIAYTSLNKLRMKEDAEGLSMAEKVMRYIYKHYDRALSTILIGNNLVNIAATSIATVLAVNLAASMDGKITDDMASTITTFVMTVLILIFGEITPKIIARRASEGFAKIAALPLRVLMVIFFPLVWMTTLIVDTMSVLWRKSEEEDVTITEEEFENILDTVEDEGVIDETQTDLLQSALEFTDLDASDILTPRIDVIGFEIHDSMEYILQTISETQFSRYPVYDRTIDHIVGVLIVKHLLKELMDDENVKLESLLLEPVYIPKTMKLHSIMNEFRRNQTHMAVVADEYGGTMGIVTMEDVLEELVGEIWDENDDIVNDWQEITENRFECSGDMNLTELFDNLDLDDEELESAYSTAGGWATEIIGAMPVAFDAFDYEHYTILVKEVDENHRISRLLILKHKTNEEDED